MDNSNDTDLSQLEVFEQALKQLIIEGFIEVPILPEAANKALLLAKQSDVSSIEMINLIRSDNYLTGQVLKIADSNEYTPNSKLITLQQAVARLGMNTISDILFSVVKSAKIFHAPDYDSYVIKLRDHALLTSLWAGEIARHLRGNVEVCRLVGRMHSIGRPAVLQAILDLAEQQQLSLSEQQVHQLEDKYCQQVTELTMARWVMPSRVIAAIEHMHSKGNSHIAMKIAETVNVAAAFASHMLEDEQDEIAHLFELEALDFLNLYQDDVEKLLELVPVIHQRLENAQ